MYIWVDVHAHSPDCVKVHRKHPLLLIGKSSICGNSRFSLEKYVPMSIWLASNSQWYENQCVLEALFKKTNFSLFTCTWIYVYTDTHIYKDKYIHVHIKIYIHIYTYQFMYIYSLKYLYVYTHMKIFFPKHDKCHSKKMGLQCHAKFIDRVLEKNFFTNAKIWVHM